MDLDKNYMINDKKNEHSNKSKTQTTDINKSTTKKKKTRT